MISVILMLASISSSTSTAPLAAVASWYGEPFHGRLTACGEVYDMNQLTCAHKEFQIGTVLRITNHENGRTESAIVTDRGPYIQGRDIDLSRAAADSLGIIEEGVVDVSYEILGRKTRDTMRYNLD